MLFWCGVDDRKRPIYGLQTRYRPAQSPHARPRRRAPPRRTPVTAYGDVATLGVSWRRTLAAESQLPATLDTYLRTVRLFRRVPGRAGDAV